MTQRSQAITALAIAQRDREAAQARYRRALGRRDAQAASRALARLQEATERCLRLEAAL